MEPENTDDNILYDLSVPAEWPTEAETIKRCPKGEQSVISFRNKLTSAFSGTIWLLLRSVGLQMGSGLINGLPASLVKLINQQMTWNIAVSVNREYVAIMRTNVIEIRMDSDEYATVIGRCSISVDLRPQWRRMSWNLSGDLLACSNSEGLVQVFDVAGTLVCEIKPPFPKVVGQPLDLTKAVASLVFKEHKKDIQAELLVITHKGMLRSYHISHEGIATVHHKYSFSSHYPNGVGFVVYEPTQALLYVGGTTSHVLHDQRGADSGSGGEEGKQTAAYCGITAWRVLSDMPHYKLSTDYEYDKNMAKKSLLVNKLKSGLSWYQVGWKKVEQDGVYKLAISPNGALLAVIHYSGAFSLWELPSLRNRAIWTQPLQPMFNEQNPTITDNPKRRKVLKEYVHAYNLVDVNWWSDNCVILCRGTGAVSLSSVNTLDNLLGSSPEWFEPMPAVSRYYKDGFIGLECEIRSSQKRTLHDAANDDYDSDEDESLLAKTTGYAKQVLYYVTDSERFQPPKKRAKKVNKTYRMVCFKSTTPEQLYTRKIESEEYGEALSLAKSYGLDCDLVYQRQWRKTEVSVASIQDYLSKISKRSWVLRECLERVPTNIDSQRELLRYALRGTDLQALIAVGEDSRSEKFITSDVQQVGDGDESLDVYDGDSSDLVEHKKRRQAQLQAQLISNIDFSCLNEQQKQLCRTRRKILTYLDRLATYEEILGGIHHADERFDSSFYAQFRQKNIVQAALDYARSCDWQALDIIFTYHGRDTLPHRLAILSNFPETFSPYDYKQLLPTVSATGEMESWPECSWRDKDWCEEDVCVEALGLSEDAIPESLEQALTPHEKFHGKSLSADLVSEWYTTRACEIEDLSCQVDHATELIKLAQERYVQGLDTLYEDLLTMETLVYDCGIETSFSLQTLQKKTMLEKVQLIMSACTDDMYIKRLRMHLLPFLQRCCDTAQADTLLQQYLISLAASDLKRCLMVFQESRPEQPKPVISDACMQISLALECIYACTSCDELSTAFSILECLPERGFGKIPEALVKLHRKLDELRSHLEAAEILSDNGVPQKISYFKESQHSSTEAEKLFIKMTRTAGRREKLTEKEWKKLFTDILNLRTKVYRCVHTDRCYEIFIQSLLCHGRKQEILLAGTMMHVTSMSQSDSEGSDMDNAVGDIYSSGEAQPVYKISYKKAIALILDAGREYLNASTSLVDDNMELARCCLGLIKDRQSDIQEELDLVEGLALLASYGVKTLPLQVRMCETRVDYIHRALAAKPAAYRKSQKLIQLGHLLRVSHDVVTCEGMVLRLVARCALNDKDYDLCYQTCSRLMAIGYDAVWEECLQLAQAEHFTSVKTKIELLSFAVTHCSGDKIDSILRAKCLLQSQVLYDKVHSETSVGKSSSASKHELSSRDSSSRDSTSRESSSSREFSPAPLPFSASSAIKQTRDLLKSTSSATHAVTHAVFSHVGDKKWWKQVVTSAAKHTQRSDRTVGVAARNTNMEMQYKHHFYLCNSDKRLQNIFDDLDSPTNQGTSSLTQFILRTCKIEEMLTNAKVTHSNKQVLLQLARDAFSHDVPLALSYLLSLSEDDAAEADGCFSALPHNGWTLHAAAYYYSLRIYMLLHPTISHTLYAYKPTAIVDNVYEYVRAADRTKACDAVERLVEKFSVWHDKYMDFVQAQLLQGLNRGVDIERFVGDQAYKVDTILGLAMTTEESVYEVSVSLSERYNLPLWDVYMTHLEYLFDSGMPTSDIEARVSGLGIILTLHTKPSEFVSRMNTYVYPTIAGTDHTRLLYYYSLMNLKSGDATAESFNADKHIITLKKLRSASSGLDYKKLFDGKHNALDVIRPILNKGNVHVLAKMVPKIPQSSGTPLTSSVVFCAWSLQMFWDDKKEPENQESWLNRFNQCDEYSHRLLADDYLQFINGCVFVKQALSKLDISTRRDILKRGVRFCGKKKKEDQQQSQQSWGDVQSKLQSSLKHLEQLEGSEKFRQLRDEHRDNKNVLGYLDQVDLCMADAAKLETVLINMLLDGQPIELVQDISVVLPNVNTQPERIVTLAFERLSELTRSTDSKKWLSVCASLVSVISDHQKNSPGFMTSAEVLRLVEPLLCDQQLSTDDRLHAITLIEKAVDMATKDETQLILYKTRVLVLQHWSELEVTNESISSDAQRHGLYVELLASCSDVEHYRTLYKLLTVWPTLQAVQEQSSNPTSQPWCMLITQLTSLADHPGVEQLIINIVRHLAQVDQLSRKCIESIFATLSDNHMELCAVKTVLIMKCSELYEAVVDRLHHLPTHIQETEDNELYELILQNHLLPSVVKCSLYEPITRYIITSQSHRSSHFHGSDDGGDDCLPYYLCIDTIVNQLHEQGYQAEAAALLVQHKGAHPALAVYDHTWSILKSWLK